MSLEDYALVSPVLRWLYIDFNSYFASVEQQLQPRLRHRPVAVVPVDSDSTSVIAASYEAKAFGIKTGTPVYEARRLCPEIICVLAHHEHYVAFHDRIKIEVDRHIPVTRVCSIDELACELMDNETDVARACEIARSIKAGLARNLGPYVRCSIGLAPSRYLAKIATDLHKPDGLTILGAHNLPTRLLDLPLQDFPGIGHNMERRLIAAGVTTTRILFSLSATQMRKIWGGVWGERMWHFLRGVDLPDEEPVRRSLGHSHVLAPELRIPARAKLIARRLTLKSASRLRRLNYYAAAFCLSVRIENGPRLHFERHCSFAQDSFTFLALMNEVWAEMMQAARPRLIKKVSVTLYHLREAAQIQPGLFDHLALDKTPARHKAERLSVAMDMINQRFGRDSILVGMVAAQGKSFTGTKIAFTRIPDQQEFHE